jgi:RNA polymerase sigma factor (sigma-70 family)
MMVSDQPPATELSLDDYRPDTLDVADVYRGHASWLKGVLRRRFGVEAVDDLLQETFLRLVSYRVRPNPRPLLMTVALNAARDQARQDGVRIPSVGGTDLDSGTEVTIHADQAETLLFKEIILSLPPKFRRVFLLSRIGGLTYVEIAQRCGISVKTVEWRMNKALFLCEAQMRD